MNTVARPCTYRSTRKCTQNDPRAGKSFIISIDGSLRIISALPFSKSSAGQSASRSSSSCSSRSTCSMNLSVRSSPVSGFIRVLIRRSATTSARVGSFHFDEAYASPSTARASWTVYHFSLKNHISACSGVSASFGHSFEAYTPTSVLNSSRVIPVALRRR